MASLKILVERYADGYVAYPVGLKGVIVGEGDSHDEAIADVTSAIRFHIETFGAEALEMDPANWGIRSSLLLLMTCSCLDTRVRLARPPLR
ncbi:MAG TPA: hypothetical protein VEZ11_09435 [Thermoanaerobaculia bacterium]|nr:hypothetical protein [Thermoanaerobaculia bacterium]